MLDIIFFYKPVLRQALGNIYIRVWESITDDYRFGMAVGIGVFGILTLGIIGVGPGSSIERVIWGTEDIGSRWNNAASPFLFGI